MLILKSRYDYFPSVERFVLRMPSGIHEIFLHSVVKALEQQISVIASSQSPSADFAQNISYYGSTTIFFDDPDYGKHDPDASFYHSQAQYPGIVLEVSYSQKRKDLARLADEYILGSDGNIPVVVGLDIEYSGKEATLSIWRPQFLVNDAGEEELQAEQTVINQVWTSTSSLFVSTHSLKLDVPRWRRRSESRSKRRVASAASRLCHRSISRTPWRLG